VSDREALGRNRAGDEPLFDLALNRGVSGDGAPGWSAALAAGRPQ